MSSTRGQELATDAMSESGPSPRSRNRARWSAIAGNAVIRATRASGAQSQKRYVLLLGLIRKLKSRRIGLSSSRGKLSRAIDIFHDFRLLAGFRRAFCRMPCGAICARCDDPSLVRELCDAER